MSRCAARPEAGPEGVAGWPDQNPRRQRRRPRPLLLLPGRGTARQRLAVAVRRLLSLAPAVAMGMLLPLPLLPVLPLLLRLRHISFQRCVWLGLSSSPPFFFELLWYHLT